MSTEPFDLDTEYDFYGVDGECFKIDDKVIKVLEDPSDGWRSMLGSIEVADPGEIENLTFFGRRLDVVKIREVSEGDGYEYGDFEGFALVSLRDGHVWLKFGTRHFNDYYPCFLFAYYPRKDEP